MCQNYHLHYLFFILTSFFVISCSKESELDLSREKLSTKSIQYEELKGTSNVQSFAISERMVREYYNQFEPENKIKSIDSFKNNHTNNLYIVNFNDGWSIVSSDTRSNFVLAKGESGSFDINSVNRGVLVWLDNMAEQLSSFSTSPNNTIKEQRIWKEIRFLQQGDSLMGRSLDPDQPYAYLVCSLPQTDTTVVNNYVPHLMSTRWGQGEPWNNHIPNNYLVGCAATAVSQVLYYFHDSIGLPSDLYHTITPVDSTILYGQKYYTVSRSNYTSNSSRWAEMPLDSSEYTDITAGYVSDLMFDVGTRLNMGYGYSASYIIVSPQGEFSLNPINISYNWNVYTKFLILGLVNNLENAKPIIVTASLSQQGYNGHTWVIDGCYRATRTITNPLYFVKIPVSEVDYYDLHYNVIYRTSSLAAMLNIYPDFVENTIQPNATIMKEDYYYMNWGFDGDMDDAMYSMDVSAAWDVFAYGKAVHYNLIPGSLSLEINQ